MSIPGDSTEGFSSDTGPHPERGRAEKPGMPLSGQARIEKLYADGLRRQQKREAAMAEAEKKSLEAMSVKPLPQKPTVDRTRIEPPQVVTRLLQSDKKRAEKLVQLKNEQLEREKQECTFAPQVQHQSTPLKINSNSDEDIWTRLSKTGSKDVDALQKMKEDKDRRDCTFKPQIHSTPPTSALLIPSSAKSDVYTRLYDDGMRRVHSGNETPRFVSSATQRRYSRGSSPLLGFNVPSSARGRSPQPFTSPALSPAKASSIAQTPSEQAFSPATNSLSTKPKHSNVSVNTPRSTSGSSPIIKTVPLPAKLMNIKSPSKDFLPKSEIETKIYENSPSSSSQQNPAHHHQQQPSASPSGNNQSNSSKSRASPVLVKERTINTRSNQASSPATSGAGRNRNSPNLFDSKYSPVARSQPKSIPSVTEQKRSNSPNINGSQQKHPISPIQLLELEDYAVHNRYQSKKKALIEKMTKKSSGKLIRDWIQLILNELFTS